MSDSMNCELVRSILALESRHTASSGCSMRSLLLDEDRMRLGQWVGSVLCISSSALSLLIGWQEGHQAHKTCPTCSQGLLSRTSEGRKPMGNWLIQSRFTWKIVIKMKVNTLWATVILSYIYFYCIRQNSLNLSVLYVVLSHRDPCNVQFSGCLGLAGCAFYIPFLLLANQCIIVGKAGALHNFVVSS